MLSDHCEYSQKPPRQWRASPSCVGSYRRRRRCLRLDALPYILDSERCVEADLALHADLIGGDPPFEEIGQFLHVL